MTRPVAVRVSQATRLTGSSARQASRIASEIWSAILSGWPSVTDSEVNKKRFLDGKYISPLITCASVPRDPHLGLQLHFSASEWKSKRPHSERHTGRTSFTEASRVGGVAQWFWP